MSAIGPLEEKSDFALTRYLQVLSQSMMELAGGLHDRIEPPTPQQSQQEMFADFLHEMERVIDLLKKRRVIP